MRRAVGGTNWSQAGDPEIMAGSPTKLCQLALLLACDTPAVSAPGLWSQLPANDLWFCLRIHIGVSLAWGHQTHFTCALHQIWSQMCQAGVLTQCDTYHLPPPCEISLSKNISYKRPTNPGHTQSIHECCDKCNQHTYGFSRCSSAVTLCFT